MTKMLTRQTYERRLTGDMGRRMVQTTDDLGDTLRVRAIQRGQASLFRS